MMAHPAYPTRADCARRGAAHRLALRHAANNHRIADILARALAEIEACDLTGFSCVAGYDLCDLPAHLRDMMPDADGDLGHALDDWAMEQIVAAHPPGYTGARHDEAQGLDTDDAPKAPRMSREDVARCLAYGQAVPAHTPGRHCQGQGRCAMNPTVADQLRNIAGTIRARCEEGEFENCPEWVLLDMIALPPELERIAKLADDEAAPWRTWQALEKAP